MAYGTIDCRPKDLPPLVFVISCERYDERVVTRAILTAALIYHESSEQVARARLSPVFEARHHHAGQGRPWQEILHAGIHAAPRPPGQLCALCSRK